MAKQRHELARGLGVAEGPANLLLHPPPRAPLLYAASLFPLLQRRFLEKKAHLRLCILATRRGTSCCPS